MNTFTKNTLLVFGLLIGFSFSSVAQEISYDTFTDSEIRYNLISSFQTGIFDEGAAEISAYDAASSRLFFTNADANAVVVLDLSDPANPTEITTLDMSTYGGGVNSVAVYNGLVAVAVQANTKTDNGSVVFFNASDAAFISEVTAGALPDMVAFTPDGSKVIVANEGEPSDDYSVDPEGSVSIIDVSGGAASATIVTADFTAFNADSAALIAEGVRIFGPGASVAQDLEPEYVAVNAAGTIAYVSLQENNALAVVDLVTNTITDILPLGYKDHSLAGNELDASNRDDAINIQNWPVLGMYQPDAIATYEVNGTTYIVSVNEGDARDYDTYSEEARMADLTLDPTIFTDATLLNDENLGRLKTTTALADTNANGEYQTLYSYGARSFSVWDATDGSLVFDSGSQLETKLAELVPDYFNSTNSENDSFDNRSDDKGPEPEAITIVNFNGRILALIGLERIGGVMTYDISDPANPEYLSYSTDRNYDVPFDEDLNNTPGILDSVKASGPESITFITQGQSTTGKPYMVVSNETTGTITISEVIFKSEAAPLFISEYAEGSSNNKYIELYNPTNEDVSLEDYAIASTGNAPSEPGNYEFWNSFTATDIVPAKGTFLWVNPNAADSLLDIADATGSAFFNGNDAYALVYGTEENYEILDILGSFLAEDNWDVGSTAGGMSEQTLVRKPEVNRGNPAPLGSFGTDDASSEWIVLDQNDFSDAGTHNQNGSFILTLLHNNDGESQLIDLGGSNSEFGGVARFKTVVDRERATDAAMGRSVLLLSSGDNFLAGPEYTVGDRDEIFYDALAIDALGYDALSLGNHDFDFGPDLTAEFIFAISESSPPFLSANIDVSANSALLALQNSGRIAKSTILEVDGDSVGVIGAITPNLPFISSPGNVVVDENVTAAVQSEIDALEAAGVNKIVLISHLQGIEEDSVLASNLSGIDIMIAGGGDELLANEGNLLVPGDEGDVYGSYPIITQNQDGDDVPIVTTRGNYSYLGKLVVEFDDAGTLTFVSDESGPIRIAGGTQTDAVLPDPDLQTNVVDPVAEGLEVLASNVIATSEVGLDAVRSNIRAVETNEGNLITDAFLWQANQLAASFGAPEADVAIANGGGIRNDNVIPAGEITELTTFDMLPFLNFISVVEGVTPERFKLMMENAVSRTSLDGENVISSGSGTGRFAQIGGFSIEYNINETALELDNDGNVVTEGRRIISITLDDGTEIISEGVVADGAPNVNLATADFTARGGDQYPLGDLDLTLLGVTYQQALANFITADVADGGLGGLIAAVDYPEGGVGRIALTDAVATSNEDEGSSLPNEFTLSQNYPNPFNPTTNIQFSLPQASAVNLSVYNALGQKVATLVNTTMSAGSYNVSFDAAELSSGLYIYRIQAGSFSTTRKMMLIK